MEEKHTIHPDSKVQRETAEALRAAIINLHKQGLGYKWISNQGRASKSNDTQLIVCLTVDTSFSSFTWHFYTLSQNELCRTLPSNLIY